MKPLFRQRLVAFVIATIASLGVFGWAQMVPILQVDGAADRHLIDPNIYGIVSYGLDVDLAKELSLPNVRWGGDGTTRYNWQVDASNSGSDWFFTGGNGSATSVPSASADAMVRKFKRVGTQSLLTIPIIPYINKSSSWNCSFPVSVYGPQESINPYVHPDGSDCGDSISPTGDQLIDFAIYSNHVDNSPTFQMGWLQHLTETFGYASQDGIGFYQLDNEPSGWSNTHRDVQPDSPTYSTIVSLGQTYAEAVKAIDPSANVMGPSDFTLGGWIGIPTQQDGLFAGQYYLQQMAAFDRLKHRRFLDYFDEHYYFQFSNAAEQLASTRTLWDSTYNGGTWVEQYAFHGPMQLIPRFKTWIEQYYPKTKLAISEYSIDSGDKTVIDAIAEADVLGIFGREGVDFANMWNSPQPTDPIANAFRLFRNFDGKGGHFGNISVQGISSDESQLAVYAAENPKNSELTIVVLNKTAVPVQTFVRLRHYRSDARADTYQYSDADLTRIVSLPRVTLVKNRINYTFPPYSATEFALAATPEISAKRLHSCTPQYSQHRRCKEQTNDE